jgi:hypothetical protein
VQIRRLTAAAVAALALAGLAACRTAPNVAAYVGDTQVTVDQLEAAVDDRLEDPAIEQAAGSDRVAYTRQVLTRLVQDEINAVAAQRYGVEVSDSDVRARLDVLLAGQDQEQAYAQLAQQGISREDAFSIVRQQLIRMEIAKKEGLDDALSEEALRKRFEESSDTSKQIDFGYITVPNERVARQVVRALEANPDRYAQLAERYAGDYTVAQPSTISLDQVPGPLAQQAAAAEVGTAFAVPVEETGGIVVGFVAGAPTFEDSRAQLEQQAAAEVDKAVDPFVQKVEKDLDVVVNPRYGDLEDGQVQRAENGVVDIQSEG